MRARGRPYLNQNSLNSFLGLLGPKLPLPLVPLHVEAGVLDLGLGPVQALLQLGNALVDHLRLQPPVRQGRPALGCGGLALLLDLRLPCLGVRRDGLLSGRHVQWRGVARWQGSTRPEQARFFKRPCRGLRARD